jgi:excisionase family DNA binding protein
MELAQQQPILLTLAEAAQLLRLRPSTLRAWRLAKKFLTFRKIGGRVLVARKDVESLIEHSAATATPAPKPQRKAN